MPPQERQPAKTEGGFDYYDVGTSQTLRLPSEMPLKNKLKIIERHEALAAEEAGVMLPEAFASAKAAHTGMKEISPELIRYGVPLIFDALTKGKTFLAGQAAVDGLAELGARELEDYLSKQEYGFVVDRVHGHANNVLGGAGAAATTLAVGKVLPPILEHILQGGRWAAAKMAKRFITPQRMDAEVLSAARALKRASTPQDIYGMTIGQLNRGTNNWMTFIEDTFRSSLFGKKRFYANDLHNIIGAEDLLDDWMRANTRAIDPGIPVGDEVFRGKPAHRNYGFGRELKQALDGEINWTDGIKSVLYNRYRNIMQDLAATNDLRTVGSFLADRIEIDDYNSAWRLIDDLVGARGRGIGTANFAAVDADTALRIRTRLNDAINQVRGNPKMDYRRKVFTEVQQRVRAAIYGSARSASDQAADALKLADDYTGSVAEAFNAKTFKALRDRLVNAPEGVIGAIAIEGKHLSNLEAVENYFIRPSVPGVSEATAARYGIAAGETTLGREAFERTVLEPLKHSILSEAVKSGQVSGSELKKILGRYEPAFIRKVFTEEGYRQLQDIASTLTLMQQTAGAGGNKVWIQLVQGGLLTSLGMYAASGGNVKVSAGGAITVLLAPGALGRMLTNRNFNQLLIDYSLGTIPAHTFTSRASTILTSQYIVSRIKDISKLPGQAREFFQDTAATLTGATMQNTTPKPEFGVEDYTDALVQGMQGP